MTDPDPFFEQRKRLVDSFSESKMGVSDQRILEVMIATPRHLFIPSDQQNEHAYDDEPQPIGHGQTISQPSLVAYMTQLLKPQATDRILEIGTGSGYQAAILSPLVAEVFTIEIVAPLAEQTRKLLNQLGLTNIHTRLGDGNAGWPEAAPFDGIIVTCAPDAIPPPLIEQLAENGRLIIPVGEAGKIQELILLTKQEGQLVRKSVIPVRFVPMTGRSSDAVR